MRDHVIAVDVGTASVRAGVFSRDGAMLARATHPLQVKRPGPRRGEYASQDIWRATATAIREALSGADIAPERIAGLAFGATCSLVLLDLDRRPLPLSEDETGRYDTIAWFDHRAATEAAEFSAFDHAAVRHSGGSVSPEMQMPKLAWLKRNRPELWAKAGGFFDLADYLTFRATGSDRRSISTLAAKWFYRGDLQSPFPDDLLEKAGLADFTEKAAIPGEVLYAGTPAGRLTAQAARDFGLTTEVVVAAGLVDAYAGALGALPPPDRRQAGELALIGGTSSCIVGDADDKVFAPSLWGPYFSAIYPGKWLFEAGQSATGGLLNHLLEVHSAGGRATEEQHGRVIARITEMLAERGPGFADGLDILPDFHGSRSPFADPSMTGMVAGLTLDNSFDGLCKLYWRASVAIALSLRQILTMLSENGIPATRLHLAGGHRRNPLLTKLYADATGVEVAVSPTEDVVLLGSAINAATAAGAFESLGHAAATMRAVPHVIAPNPSLAPYYAGQLRRLEILQACRAALNEA
ncbi:FGGY family pentulose kinase [Martelella limonii]|uniref:FGGY family pentulose kinase n=1 Tax=Martelella limonii TaxID=1647649 RepID=UPI001FCE97B4|nr:FGGY family pentulose kinase [Martelella limonii]